jgi:hypothetical protein
VARPCKCGFSSLELFGTCCSLVIAERSRQLVRLERALPVRGCDDEIFLDVKIWGCAFCAYGVACVFVCARLNSRDRTGISASFCSHCMTRRFSVVRRRETGSSAHGSKLSADSDFLKEKQSHYFMQNPISFSSTLGLFKKNRSLASARVPQSH